MPELHHFENRMVGRGQRNSNLSALVGLLPIWLAVRSCTDDRGTFSAVMDGGSLCCPAVSAHQQVRAGHPAGECCVLWGCFCLTGPPHMRSLQG